MFHIESMCEHYCSSVQCPTGRNRNRGWSGDCGVLRGHHVGRIGFQEEMAEQQKGPGKTIRQAQHCYRCQCPGLSIYYFFSFVKTSIISSVTIHNNPIFDPLPKKTFERNLKLTCHGICIGLLGKICKIFRSGAEGSEAERWLLCHGSHQSRGNGGREHHLCRCHSGFDPKRRI